VRIAIVNDLSIAVLALRRVLEGAGHEIAWIAADGMAAVEACRRDMPDLILMDLLMPRMNGAEATRQIMAETPCPILLVTANVAENMSYVFEAMGFGALDAVNTPLLGGSSEDSGNLLLAKIASIRHLIGTPRFRRARGLVVIGASAGGPGAILAVLRGLPAAFSAAIVVVQHVDPQFIPGMISWFNAQSGLEVVAAAEDAEPQPGQVAVAATGDHLILKPSGRLGYQTDPRETPYRPSVDVMFDSVARYWAGDAVGVLLSGMGRDGAAGLKRLREAGALTIAQDRASSAVWGMPKAAAEIGAATEILPLGEIAPRLVGHFVMRSEKGSLS
jgi:two-component system, chemotaxis family, response regulator WspF